jgi:hypothetical protein
VSCWNLEETCPLERDDALYTRARAGTGEATSLEKGLGLGRAGARGPGPGVACLAGRLLL